VTESEGTSERWSYAKPDSHIAAIKRGQLDIEEVTHLGAVFDLSKLMDVGKATERAMDQFFRKAMRPFQ
jgi:hypothetical protein